MAQLYPRELGSLFVASYDPQVYDGGILTRPHTGHSQANHSQSHVTTDGQSVCLDVELLLVLMTKCFLLLDGYCRAFVGHPL
jgi:hypothetical protein